MNATRRTAGLAASFLMVAACSSSGGGSGSASVSGTISGSAISATSAVGVRDTVTGAASETLVGVLITNVGNACSVLQNHGNPPSASSLTVEVVASGTTVAPGTYRIGQSGFGVSAEYQQEDSSCNTSVSSKAYAGSVTLTSVATSSVAGTFDMTFGGSDHVTGSFSAPFCTYTIAADAGAAACK